MKKLLAQSWKTLLLELIVVFVGVYLAFELNNYSESQKIRNEKDKIMTSLKQELDYIGLTFGGMGGFQQSKVEEWDSLQERGEFTSFYSWRYIQPQYNYAVLEYALNTHDARIVDFDLYEKLVKIHREIKKLEFTENLMTEWGGKFKNMPQDVDTTSFEYKARLADNRFSFYKFTNYAEDRANTLSNLPEVAREALVVINQHFSPERRFELEKAFLMKRVSNIAGIQDDQVWQRVIAQAQEHFSHVTEAEWERFRNELLAELEPKK